ncbi:MAG: 50S ribosomal protein L30 [Clostridiales Family XIII bacterium]|jgi:large subunit ribosomal protein L30|nr:50S ribosomal protein L30 [Clostridiales Family XIII bacterium]
MADKLIRIKLTKSPIGAIPTQRRTVAALGLRKLQSEVELPDTPQTRGAVRKVRHLVTVTDAPDA